MLDTLKFLFAMTQTTLRHRVAALRGAPDRGAGGISLEAVILAVGGVIVAGIVVLAVKSSIDSRISQLNP